MPLNIKESIVIVKSSDPQERRNMGTGFVVGRKDKTTFIVTCNHVLKSLGEIEKIKILGESVILIAKSEVFDLAILAVKNNDKLMEKPILKLNMIDSTTKIGIEVKTAGAFLMNDGSSSYSVIRETPGTLTEEEERIDPDTGERADAWLLKINPNKRPFQEGQSGSPVVAVEDEQVLGVLAYKGTGTEENVGYVISIKALEYVCLLEDMPNKLKQIHFIKLQDLLVAGDWKGANDQTHVLMNYLTNDKGYVTPYDIGVLFPQEDLDKINRLWSEQSGGKFGFKIQAKIYQNLVGTHYPDPKKSNQKWKNFYESIGWRKDGKWLQYDELNFSKDNVCDGYLPWPPYVEQVKLWGYFVALFLRYADKSLMTSTDIDYIQLSDYLAKRQWKEADQKTTHIMLKLATRNHERGEWLRVKDIDKFLYKELETIDELWKYIARITTRICIVTKSNLVLVYRKKNIVPWVEAMYIIRRYGKNLQIVQDGVSIISGCLIPHLILIFLLLKEPSLVAYSLFMGMDFGNGCCFLL